MYQAFLLSLLKRLGTRLFRKVQLVTFYCHVTDPFLTVRTRIRVSCTSLYSLWIFCCVCEIMEKVETVAVKYSRKLTFFSKIPAVIISSLVWQSRWTSDIRTPGVGGGA